MQTYYEKIPLAEKSAFYYKELDMPQFDAPRHFHPEYEIMYVMKSQGKRFVGDNISAYRENDLVLLGPNLPHYWYKEPDINKPQHVNAIVIQFKPDFLLHGFLSKLEMKPLADMLQLSSRGIKFDKKTSLKVYPKLKNLKKETGFKRVLLFLDILHQLSQTEKYTLLCSSGYKPTTSPDDSQKIGRIYQYILDHFLDEIVLDEVAELAGMTKTAFCHYFKKRTRKNFSKFVNEMRIGHASRLLIETDMNVSEICYASGYKNLSNFNRRFKELNGNSPLEYRKQFQSQRILPSENFDQEPLSF